MKKIIAIILCATFLTGCAQINDSVQNLEQSCAEGKEEYNKIKPKLDRDFKLLFGTDERGNIDTGVESISPGVQDIVYAQFESFSDTQQKQLWEANTEGKEIYRKYAELTSKIEKRGPQFCNSVKDLNEFLKTQEVKENGLGVLKEFIRVAGKAYIKQ